MGRHNVRIFRIVLTPTGFLIFAIIFAIIFVRHCRKDLLIKHFQSTVICAVIGIVHFIHKSNKTSLLSLYKNRMFSSYVVELTHCVTVTVSSENF